MGKGGWLGPVLRYELIRLTRRGWATIFLARAIYIALLFLALVLFYVPVGPGKDAAAASRFFNAMMGVQFAAVLLLTPAYTAGAIAEDRERRTLDFLLASDLSDREIVLGKYFARVATLGLLLLAGLPVLGLVQLLGGVDPNLVLAGFLALALMMGSLGSVAVLQSIHSRRPREAVFRTYLIAGIYLMFSFIYCLSDRTGTTLGHLEHIPGVFGSGNPLFVLKRLEDGLASGSSLGQVLPVILIDYAIFHVVIMLALVAESIRQLRPSLARTPESPAVEYGRDFLIRRGIKDQTDLRQALHPLRKLSPSHPAVSDQPLLWKEMHVEPRPYHLPGVLGSCVHSAFVIGFLIFGSAFLLLLGLGLAGGMPAELINIWARIIGSILVCMSVLGVAVRAAGCLSRERERQTLDALLTTPLSDRAIINEKWLGSVLSVRAGWECLAAAWMVATATGGIDWRMLPLLLIGCASFTALAAGLGLCCSLLCRTTGRATAVTLGVLIVLAVPWRPGRGVPTPVEALDLLTLPLGKLDSAWEVPRALLSVLGCAVFAALLWIAAQLLFGPVTGRISRSKQRSGPRSEPG